MTQKELAERLRISVRYIQQLEGRYAPNVKLETMVSLAKILKVKVCDLVRGL